MSLNYDYLISRASKHTNKIKLLDYGCGNGQVVESGTYDELISQEREFQQIVQMQS